MNLFIKEIVLFTDTFVQSDLQMKIKQANQHEDSRGQKQRKNCSSVFCILDEGIPVPISSILLQYFGQNNQKQNVVPLNQKTLKGVDWNPRLLQCVYNK